MSTLSKLYYLLLLTTMNIANAGSFGDCGESWDPQRGCMGTPTGFITESSQLVEILKYAGWLIFMAIPAIIAFFCIVSAGNSARQEQWMKAFGGASGSAICVAGVFVIKSFWSQSA